MTATSPITWESAELRAQLDRLLKTYLGSSVKIAAAAIGNQRHDYLVLLLELKSPARQIVVKLAGPAAPYNYPFERTAQMGRLVAAQTDVPMAEVIAADESYAAWPWRFMIKAHIPGIEWVDLRRQLAGAELADAYRQIGSAVAQIHRITFPAFGELSPAGELQPAPSYLDALRRRAAATISRPRLQAYFAEVLHHYQSLFADVGAPSLCHEDLHQHNILFARQADGSWRLATILDFDKAWAGQRETDLARLDLWRDMSNAHFWAGYEAIYPAHPLYPQRRPIFQLLWCLEVAWSSAQHLADTRRVCLELGFPVIASFD